MRSAYAGQAQSHPAPAPSTIVEVRPIPYTFAMTNASETDAAVTKALPVPIPVRKTLTARAILLGDRIDTAGLERSDMLSSAPLAFRMGQDGYGAIFRYGVVVMVGLSPVEEDEFLRGLKPRVAGAYAGTEDESAQIEVAADRDDHVPPGGKISLKSLSPDRLLVVADALAKSMALGRDEREVAKVLDLIEPLARTLATTGKTPARRRDILKLIGQSLHVQHRMSGRVAVEEKPDVLWDRADLERLYARLEDEYELKERAQGLTRKIDVIRETAQALTDLIDTERSLRLEAAVVLLIVLEVVLTIFQIVNGRH